MQILFPSDVFPPTGKGGAAWSSHALASALIDTGHQVLAVVPQRGQGGLAPYDALGVPALRVPYRAPNLPIVQNYFRHERLWQPFADAIILAAEQNGGRPDLIHAQHVQAAPAAILAGRSLGVPVVVTIRDHWPWDYFATGLHGDRLPYPATSWASMATDLVARLGPAKGALALPAMPYMLSHLRRRQRYLAQADAVIACSSYIAERLSAIVPPEHIHVLPHIVDSASTAEIVAAPPELQLEGPFLLFAGKLEPNKGAGLLPAIFRALKGAHPDTPPFTLVIAGDGVLRPRLERELGELGVKARFLEWASHNEILRLMARCALLLFPSAWGEPLSRVLLEASSVGAPILAIPTGGTPDIISDGENGAFARTPEAFAAQISNLLRSPDERQRLGQTARVIAQQRYSPAALLPRYTALYHSLIAEKVLR